MLESWSYHFPNCEPIADYLKVSFPDRWVRFHSLPGSQRYAADDPEYATILDRHNRILTELTGGDGIVVLLTTSYSATPMPNQSLLDSNMIDPRAVLWRTIAMHELEGDIDPPNYWHLFASQRSWSPGMFDDLVRKVSDDEIANVMMVAGDCTWLLHPYDGGMDVILESSAARESLKARHRDWLSPYLSGL